LREDHGGLLLGSAVAVGAYQASGSAKDSQRNYATRVVYRRGMAAGMLCSSTLAGVMGMDRGQINRQVIDCLRDVPNGHIRSAPGRGASAAEGDGSVPANALISRMTVCNNQ